MADPVDAVLFDLDGTLVEYRRDGAEVLARAFEAAGIDPFFDVAAYYDRIPELLEAADSTADLRERCFAAIAAERGRDPAAGRAVARAYAAERDHANVRPRPGAGEAVSALAGRYRLGMVTNADRPTQTAKLAAVGLADAFETVVYAGYEAPAKPDPAPFERALRALSVPADRAVYVGDRATDVEGADAAGLRSVWIPRDPDVDVPTDGVDPDHRIDALDALTRSPRPWE